MKPWHKIRFWRRTAQAVSFILIVYGGYIFKAEFLGPGEVLKIERPEDKPATSAFSKDQILWASDDPRPLTRIRPRPPADTIPAGGCSKPASCT